ncbi:MAG: hypothetical protein AB8G23_06555 [Myxococcota bacterium]
MSDDAREEDRMDALISASLDDALSPEEAAELAALMAGEGMAGEGVSGEGVASRAQDFEDVDAALRALAEEPLDEARLEASLEAVQERLFESSPDAAVVIAGEAVADEIGVDAGSRASGRSESLFSRIRPAFYGGMAAAAAAMLFFAVGSGSDALRPGDLNPGGGLETLAEEAALGELTDEALVAALGYGAGPADLSELGLASPEDLEIVEQLELLDFLAAREAEGRG